MVGSVRRPAPFGSMLLRPLCRSASSESDGRPGRKVSDTKLSRRRRDIYSNLITTTVASSDKAPPPRRTASSSRPVPTASASRVHRARTVASTPATSKNSCFVFSRITLAFVNGRVSRGSLERVHPNPRPFEIGRSISFARLDLGVLPPFVPAGHDHPVRASVNRRPPLLVVN